jgi:hypothetical protein
MIMAMPHKFLFLYQRASKERKDKCPSAVCRKEAGLTTNAFTNSEAYCTVPEQDRTPGHEVPHYYRIGDPRKPPQQKRKR